ASRSPPTIVPAYGLWLRMRCRSPGVRTRCGALREGAPCSMLGPGADAGGGGVGTGRHALCCAPARTPRVGRSHVASLTFQNVTKRFDDVVAVDDLDLEISDGEFMVLLGPSGCGKTTALRMIAGLEDITEGKLLIGDTIVNDVDPAKRDVSMVFQSYALYPHMTVQRDIESPLLVRRYPADGPDRPVRKLTRAERQERVNE